MDFPENWVEFVIKNYQQNIQINYISWNLLYTTGKISLSSHEFEYLFIPLNMQIFHLAALGSLAMMQW